MISDDSLTGSIQALCFAVAAGLLLKGLFLMAKSTLKSSTTVNAANDYVRLNTTKLKKKVEKEVSNNYLTSCTWQLYSKEKEMSYIFRNGGELLISKDGNVKKASYEFIVDNNSIIIERKGKTTLWDIVHAKDDFLFLSKVSTHEVMYFYNRTKVKDEVKKVIRDYQKIYLANL